MRSRSASFALAAVLSFGVVACDDLSDTTVDELAEGATSVPEETDLDDEPEEGESPGQEVSEEPGGEPVDPSRWESPNVGECSTDASYQDLDATEIEDDLLGTLSHPGGAFRADAELSPLTKAILLVESDAGEMERARFRVRHGIELRDQPPAADPVEFQLIQVDRFVIAPAFGPHLSYCFEFRPIQALTAALFDASVAEIPEAAAAALDCMGTSCTSEGFAVDPAAPWQMGSDTPITFDTVYASERDDVPSPAAAMDLALVEMGVATATSGQPRWQGFEHREGVVPGEPFVHAVVEFGIGQDSMVDVAIRETHLMDDSTSEMWQRVSGLPTGDILPGTHSVPR